MGSERKARKEVVGRAREASLLRALQVADISLKERRSLLINLRSVATEASLPALREASVSDDEKICYHVLGGGSPGFRQHRFAVRYGA